MSLVNAEASAGHRFAAYVSHELRTPLATQRALLELALGDPETDTTVWREIGQEVLEACRQQERTLAACLALARAGCGAGGSRERFDLGSLVGRAIRRASPASATVRSRLESAHVVGDPALVERLVDNLLANGQRHNLAGGWVAVTTGQAGATSLLAVENSGPRIPAGEVAKLFEPFRQYRRRGSQRTGGFGLGLAVAKAVADAHDALITALARQNGGLRVEVAFPAPFG